MGLGLAATVTKQCKALIILWANIECSDPLLFVNPHKKSLEVNVITSSIDLRLRKFVAIIYRFVDLQVLFTV